MKLMAYDENDNTHEVDALYLDGYGFGDRLLEKVIFKITLHDGNLIAECLDKYDPGINWDYWEKECVKYAVGDVLSTSADPYNDDGFIEE